MKKFTVILGCMADGTKSLLKLKMYPRKLS